MRGCSTSVVVFLIAVGSSAAMAENELSVLTGNAWTDASDVRLSGDETDLTYHGVAWRTRPQAMPPYYALRYTHWLSAAPVWGWSVDFLHAKMISDSTQVLPVNGLLEGIAIDESVALGDHFSALEFSDGHNLLTASLLRRGQPFADSGSRWLRDASVYGGVGVGVALPHVEASWGEGNTFEYQLAGPAAQALAGVSVPLGKHWSLSGEYRHTWAQIDAALHDSLRLETDARTQHLTLGIGFRFGGRN